MDFLQICREVRNFLAAEPFKQFMETGEVVRSEGSPEGARALRQAKQRPARPVK